jgi:pimeloyl-ACP methyl ester carboxylesterase
MAIYDEGLRRWPVPFEAFFVDTRYGKTHVIVSGDPASPPLVMTHPMGVGGFVWSTIIAALSAHRRAYALDTIGDVGKSVLADPDRYPKQGRDYSAWLDDVFTALDLTAADMVAGSMGGWIAMNDAIYAPDRVRRLVLLGPMGLAPWRATLGFSAHSCPSASGQRRPSSTPSSPGRWARASESTASSVHGCGSWDIPSSVSGNRSTSGSPSCEWSGRRHCCSSAEGRPGRQRPGRGQAGPAQHHRMRDRGPTRGRSRHERRRTGGRRRPHHRLPGLMLRHAARSSRI